MKLFSDKDDLNAYLESSEIIDFHKPDIAILAKKLALGIKDEISLAKKVYEFVRDEISHSIDIDGEVVTCKASEVLAEGHGICYAKSHLLAAILRNLGIPTGFCYQRLIFDDETRPWPVLHGLNAIYIRKLQKWIRIDARGNKEGVQAEFSIESEKLAFIARKEFGEEDLPYIFSEPNAKAVSALRKSNSVSELVNNLPNEL